MIIEILVCKPDGSQVIEQQAVADNFFDIAPELMTTQEAILDKLTELEYRQDLMELGLTEGGTGA